MVRKTAYAVGSRNQNLCALSSSRRPQVVTSVKNTRCNLDTIGLRCVPVSIRTS